VYFTRKRFNFTFQNGGNLRQQWTASKRKEKKKNLCLFSQSGGFLHSGLFDKTNSQIVPKNGLLICASKLHVFRVHLQLSLQVKV
jgi:hypothetical protein